MRGTKLRYVRATPRFGSAVLGLATAAAGIVATVLVYRIFVGTRTGQQLDNTAFRGAEIGSGTLWEIVEPVLDIVSIPFVVAVLGAAALIAVIRRRWLLAVQVVVLVGGANLTTQVLKYLVWDRPQLTELVGSVYNSLPSGHTTVAASAAAALLLVVPRSVRPTVAVLAAGYTALTGISTMIGGWHRPSDVVASVTVVLAWAGLATAVTAFGPPEQTATPDPARRQTIAVAATLTIGAAIAAVAAWAALDRTRDALAAVGTLTDRQDLATAYAGGALGIILTSALAFAMILVIHQAASHPVHTSASAHQHR